jgi:translation initiation factor IF-2
MPTTAEKIKTGIRPPIVVVVGHIDHGKTTLLDAIRKTKVAEKESGGITQHIGAYEIEHSGRKITFIDTPGHEAFSKMRSRGTAAADIGILVVAADEGVKPQTKEAIKILLDAKIPFLVAVNKIDKPGADSDRVRKELAENNVLVEQWSGAVPSIEISAKQGKNLNELLELILLMADVEELKAEAGPGTGVVIESHRDRGRGNTATLLILNGDVKRGGFLVLNGALESIKILENFLGKTIDSAEHSMPVLVSSLSKLPEVGETFHAFMTRKEAESFAAEHAKAEIEKVDVAAESSEKPMLNIVLKADVSGSKEAIEEALGKLQYPEAGSLKVRSFMIFWKILKKKFQFLFLPLSSVRISAGRVFSPSLKNLREREL